MTLSVRWQVSSAGSEDSPNRRYPSVSSFGRTFSEDKSRASWLKTTSHVLWKQRSNSQRGRRQIICPAGVVRSQRSDAKADASCSGARALSSPILAAVEIEHGWPRRIIPGGARQHGRRFLSLDSLFARHVLADLAGFGRTHAPSYGRLSLQ